MNFYNFILFSEQYLNLKIYTNFLSEIENWPYKNVLNTI
jgi:hypothetical protein